MSRVLILTAGSTGDIEPFAALAAGLPGRGHEVALAADGGFAGLAPGGEVTFRPIRADFRSLLPAPGRRRLSLRGDVFPVIRGMLEDAWTVAKDFEPDLIVAHEKSLAAPHVAERLGIPHVRALAVPMSTPTTAFPVPGLVRRDLGPRLNRASYRLGKALTRPYAGLIRSWRAKTLRLPPKSVPADAARTLYCYSPSLVPTPADWPADTVATGYWRRASGDTLTAPDPALSDFIEAGPPPVYIGFGSAVGGRPDRLGRVVAAAARRTGVRAVIASGWGAVDLRTDDDLLVVERAPHDWLFPRVAAVVHHGGAGTTAAGLLAGRPTVICPFVGDQHFWGAAVQRAGAGPAPMPARRLDEERLAAAILTALEDPKMRSRAAALAVRIGDEDGVATAAAEIEDVANANPPNRRRAGQWV